METLHIIGSLVAVIFFALIFFFGPKLRLHGPGQLYHRRFLSFAAGVSVAYVFLLSGSYGSLVTSEKDK